MSEVNETIYKKVAAQYEGVDVGPAAIYELIGQHLDMDLKDAAAAFCHVAYTLKLSPEFSRDSGATDTAVFLETVRQVCFGPIAPGVHSPATYADWISAMEDAARFFISWADHMKAQAKG